LSFFGRIYRSETEVGLEYHGEIPTFSGLGTSGAMMLIWLALINNKKKFTKKDKTDLAEHVYELEKTFKGINGKQDQYAAAIGGINFMEFKNDNVKITPVKMPKKFIMELEDSLTLVYTGKKHHGGSSNKVSIENLKSGKNNENLLKIKHTAEEMHKALLKKDLNKFADLMNDETKERAKLHKYMVPSFVRKTIKLANKNGAKAAKICGSGNGGSILFFGDKHKLKQTFQKKVLDFKFDFHGLMNVK
jgi:D-glycero-alpha-D-manno-heptose-7-phosphate kinase